MKRPAAPEIATQRAIINRLILDGIVCIAIPNAARRGPVAARRAKIEGMMAGAPDLVVLAPGGLTGFFEVKTDDGRLSPAQRETHALLARLGQRIQVVRSQDDAVAACRAWGMLP